MNENEFENVDSTNDTEETVNDELDLDLSDETSEEETNDNDLSDEVISLRKENATLKAQKEHFKKKVGTKEESKETKTEPLQNISTLEAMALIKADVTEEDDVIKVQKWANLNNIRIQDALKDSVIVKYLADKKEERETALATNTSNSRKSSTVSSEVLIDRALKGNMPKEDDIDKLVNARMEAKLKSKS